MSDSTENEDWRARNKKGLPDRTIDLLQKLELVLMQQIEQDKAQLTDLQLRRQRLETKRGK